MSNAREAAMIRFLLKLKSFLPKSQLNYYILIIFKLLPLIVITHDWNINYGSGISHIINQFSLGPILSKLSNRTVISVLSIIIFLFTVISIIINTFIKLKLYSPRHSLFRQTRTAFFVSVQWMFIVNFLFNQQVFIILIETIFNKSQYDNSKGFNMLLTLSIAMTKENMIGFILQMCVNFLMVTYSLYASYMISIVFFEPFYSSKALLVNDIGKLQWQWLLVVISQAVVQLEYHLPFKTIIFIKAISRGMYCLSYIQWFIDRKAVFYSNHKLSHMIALALTACFISCCIEFVFLTDISNDLIILTSSISYIIFKLFIEVILSMFLLFLLKMNIVSTLLKTCIDIEGGSSMHLNTKIGNDKLIYSNYNKLFYYVASPNHNRAMTVNIFKYFFTSIRDHKMRCKAKGDPSLNAKANRCFCIQYNTDTFYEQSFKYLFVYDNQKAKVSESKKNLKDQFPSFYKYIEQSLINGLEKNRYTAITNQFLLLNVLFYLEFDKNINKAFYFLEEFMKSVQYKKSLVVKVQVKLIRKYIKSKFYDLMNKSNDVNMKIQYMQFKNIIHYINVENSIRNAFKVYHDFLIQCTSDNIMTQVAFGDAIHSIIKNISIEKDVFIHYFKVDKCKHLHLCSELTLYYSFFYHDIPHDIGRCFMEVNKLEELVKFDNSKQLILSFANTPNSMFNIDYASDTLIQDLGYGNVTEITSRSLKDIVLPGFAREYDVFMRNEVHLGKTTLEIAYFCMVSNDFLLRMYSLNALVIIIGDTLKIFATLNSLEDKVLKEYNEDKVAGKAITIKPCYAIIKQNGRIMGINEEYNKYFFFNIKLIHKLKLNVFKHLLRIPPPKAAGINPTLEEKNKKIYVKAINVYNALCDIHEETMLENNNKDYPILLHKLQEVIRRLNKYPIQQHFIFNFEFISISSPDISMMINDIFARETMKKTKKHKHRQYYLLYLNIEGEKKKSLASFDPFLINSSKDKQVMLNYNLFQQYNIPISFQLSKNKTDLIEKLTLIKIQSLKALLFTYNISGSIIDLFIETKIELDTQQPTYQSEALFKDNTEHINQRLRLKSSLLIQLFVLLAILFVFAVLTILITLYADDLYNEVENLIYCGLYFLLMKKQITSLIGTVQNLQMKANGIMPDMIDNNFSNTDKEIIDALELILEDYMRFYQQSNEYFQSPQSNNIENLARVDEISNIDYPFVSLSNKLESFTTISTLIFSINYLHYRISSIIMAGKLAPMLFNNTDSEGVTSYMPSYFIDSKSEYDTISADEFHAEKISVYLIENGMKHLRYPFVEILALFDIISKEKIVIASRFLLIMCIVNSIILLVFFIYQVVFYSVMNRKLFAKSFINFCYVQYFDMILLRKTMLIRDFIEIATIETIVKLILTRVDIANSDEQSALLASKTEQIDGEYQYDIIPFQVVNEVVSIKDYTGIDFMKESNDDVEGNVIMRTLPVQLKQSRQRMSISLEREKEKEGGSHHSGSSLNMINEQKKKRLKHQRSSLIKLVKAKHSTKNNVLTHKDKPKENEEITIDNSKQRLSVVRNPNVITQNIPSMTMNGAGVISNTIASNQGLLTQGMQQTSQEEIIISNSRNQEKILKPSNILPITLLFLFFSIFSFIISFVYYFISTAQFDLLTQYNNIQSASLVRMDIFHEILTGFTSSLLKNQQVLFFYESNGYLFNNNSTTHDVITEMINEFEAFNQKFTALFQSDSLGATFSKNTQEYDDIVHSEAFCKETGDYIAKSTNTKGITFSIISLLTPAEFVNVCETIGHGFNKKGFHNAMLGLVDHVKDAYRDFVMKPAGERDVQFIEGLMKSPQLQTYYVETYYVLEFVYMCYHHAISEDYYAKVKELSLYNMAYLIVVFFCIAIIWCVYVGRLTVVFMRRVGDLEKMEVLLYHTVVF